MVKPASRPKHFKLPGINVLRCGFIAVLVTIILATVAIVSAKTPVPHKVRIAAFNFYPTLFQAEDGSVQGFYVDFISEIAKREDWSIEYVYGNWADGISRLKTGEVDILTNVAFTADRASFMDYGKVPLLTVWAELYAPNGSPMDGIRDVKGKKIALMKGDFNAASFKSLVEKFGIPCTYVEYGNYEEVFRAISARQVDGGVVNNTFGAAKQSEYGLKSTGVIFNPFDIYFTVAKGKNSAILAKLDRYLEAWRKTENSPFHRARKSWSHKTSSIIRVERPWLIKTAVVFGVLLCVVTGFVVLLRIQVRRKTAEIRKYSDELHVMSEQLKEELAERQISQESLQEQTVLLEEEIEEHRRTEESLMESELRFRTIFDVSNDAIVILEVPTGTIIDVNQTMCGMYGYSHQEALHLSIEDLGSGISPYTREQAVACLQKALAGQSQIFEWQTKDKSGRLFWVDVRMQRAIIGGSGKVIVSMRDITSRRKAEDEKAFLEAQLHQAQKMESVGRLAGGVAHDFNNMLGVIIGHAALGLIDAELTHTLHGHLVEIDNAAKRSAELTRQLLAFARKQVIEPKMLDLNDTISGMLKMLQRLIGEGVCLCWQPGNELWQIKMDPSQIDQILANLCLNARDAIDTVGNIFIKTGMVFIDAPYCITHPEASEGEYVWLSVSDDGSGMEKETLAHIFEPFFTTKGVGEGTGLGLSTVYGITKQNNGFIDVQSEPGLGTTFTIHIPRHKGVSEKTGPESVSSQLSRGSETIMLVEDEPAILNMTAMLLRKQGYKVLTAGTSRDAIQVSHEHADVIHLLLTDVVMPEMNGRDLATSLMSTHPRLKCLFMSGYTADVIAHHGVIDEGLHFIQKPFSLPSLAEKVRAVLDV